MCPQFTDLQLAGRRIEQDEAKRGEDPRVIPPENVVDQAGDRQRRVTFAGSHEDTIGHDQRFVEVPADLGLIACRT